MTVGRARMLRWLRYPYYVSAPQNDNRWPFGQGADAFVGDRWTR